MSRRLYGNAAYLWLIQLVNYIAPFFILVHLTKTLGLDIYGVLAFAQGIVAVCGVVIDFGYSLSATDKIARGRQNKKYVGRLIGGVLCVKAILFAFCSIILILYAYTTDRYADHKYLFILYLFPIFLQGFMPVWFFHGLEKIKYAAVGAIASKICFAIGVGLFVNKPSDYLLVPLLSGAGDVISIIVFLYFMKKLGYKVYVPNYKIVFYCFDFSKRFFASRVAVASYMNGAIIVLGMTSQPAVIAVYSMAEQLYKVMQSALGPVAAATYPYMTKEKNSSLMFKLLISIVSFTILGAVIGYFSAPTLVVLVFDSSWLASIPVLNVFLVAIVVHAAAIMSGYPLAALVNRLDVANSSVITGATVYFLLLLIFYLMNSISPISLSMIMLLSELAVVIQRSMILIPIALRKYQSI
jgi:PST family polysaccharide transporter